MSEPVTKKIRVLACWKCHSRYGERHSMFCPVGEGGLYNKVYKRHCRKHEIEVTL